MGLVPFQRHNANVGELHACGAGLLSDAGVALDNGSLTSSRYQPAIENWDGMCAPELANARSPILTRADDSHNALAWAAVVTQYWADRVTRFNAEVETIQAEIGTDGTYGADGEGGEDPTEEAIAAARSAARQRWNTAYNTYILDGEDQVQSMLDDGPTAANLALVSDAGVLPPPPPGALPYLNGTGHGVNGLYGGLLGYGMYSGMRANGYGWLANHWRGQQQLLSGRANRYGQLAQGLYQNYQNGRYWRGGHYRGQTWVNGHWVTRPGQSGAQQLRLGGYSRAQDGFRNASQQAVNAGQRANGAAQTGQSYAGTASRFNTAAKWAGRGGTVLTAGTSAWDQWSQDAGRQDLGDGERVGRAATRGALAAGGAALGAKGGAVAGAAIGTAIFPGVGTVVGGVVGGLVGGAIGAGAGNLIADGAMEVWDNAGDIAGSAKDAVSSGVDTVKGWFGG